MLEDLEPTLEGADGTPRVMAESPPLGPGDMPARIGRYVVLGELGAGGMGVVYAAYDPELDRKVAIKLMYAEADRGRARRNHAMLKREAQALAKLSHPNIVAIHDVGEYAGQVFVAMEFVAGCTLRRWREAQPRAWPEVLATFVQAGRGLLAAHAVGLVHRDVKPDNVLVGDDGRVRVADFGVARHNAPDSEPTAPSTGRPLETVAGAGATIGTPAYMAPEQHENAGVGPHSDQFSFCVALYEALHGVRPFAGETGAALAAAIRGGAPRRPETPVRLPPWLDRALLRGLAARPEARWPSMQALLAELTQDRDARLARWRWRALYAVMLSVAGIALYLGGRALQANRAREQQETRASERLAVVDSGIGRLLARGRRDEASEALQAFLAEPEHHGTRAAIDAWLLWADHMDRAGDHEAALAAAVEAYTELPVGDDREPAIDLRMARLFRDDGRYHELAKLATLAARRSPATVDDRRWAALRADTALALRDLSGFLAEVDAGRVDGEREAVAPVLRALDAVRFPAVAWKDIVVAGVDLEGDGRLELALFDRGGRSEIRRMDAEMTLLQRDWPALTFDRGWANRLPLRREAGRPSLLIGHAPGEPMGETTVYEVGATPRPLLRWSEHRPLSATTADLDGDGARELYVGTGPYSRRLDRVAPGADGVWRRESAHPPSEALASDFNALVAGDFDGDGREELAVALGPWRAYDVRILEAGPDGALTVGVRWRVGHVQALASLRAADGTMLLAIAKDNDAPSKKAFPADKPHGEPPGVYIMRREGAELRTVHFQPAPREGVDVGRLTWMASGDLDGDGLADLVTNYADGMHHERAQTMIYRQLPDGSFALVVLGEMEPLLVGQFDDDVADELLVQTRAADGATAFAILGAGGPALTAVSSAPVPTATPKLADPELARAWTRAEELAGLGLFAAAATALERRISLASTADDRRAVQLRAAELHDADGDHAAAAAGQELLAQDGDALAGFAALAGYERALRLVDALRMARWLLARGDLDGDQRARATAAHDRLAAVVERGDATELRFDRPLARQWRIAEPLALRVDPVRGELIVDATSEMGELASLPLTVAGGPLSLEVELEVERAEWSSILQVALEDPSGAQRLRIGVSAGGGGGYLTRTTRFDIPEHEAPAELGLIATAQPGERSKHRVQAQVLPGQGVLHLEERGDHPGQRSFSLHAPLVAGTYRLLLRAAGNPVHGGHQIRARIKRIAVTGASISAEPGTATPQELRARALVTGRWRSALAGPGEDALEELGRAVAAAELGRVGEAITILGAIDPRDPRVRVHLRQLLRARPELVSPLLRSRFPDELGALLSEALLVPTQMHLDEELQRRWLTLGGDLEALPEREVAQIETKAALLRVRARVWQLLGELALAAEDVDAATRLLAAAASDPESGPTLAELELMRAQIAAQRGLTALALAAAQRAVTGTDQPAWMVERMRMDADLQPLQAEPAFVRMLADHP